MGDRRTWIVAGGLAVTGVLAVGLLPVAVGPAGWVTAVARGGLLSLMLAGLWVPLSRWWSWPTDQRRAGAIALATTVPFAAAFAVALTLAGVALMLAVRAPGAGLLGSLHLVLSDGAAYAPIVVGTVALTHALRPVTARAAFRWSDERGLPATVVDTTAVELRRMRAWRILPAVAGLAVGVAPGLAYNLALDVLGRGGVADHLVAINNVWPLDQLTLAATAYALGAVLAEVFRRRPQPEPAGVAALETRTPAAYLTPIARWLPATLAGVAVLATLLGWPRWEGAQVAPVAAAVGAAVLVELVQRWVVGRPQRVADPDRLALDDALRSSVAHATAGASSVVLLTIALGAVQRAVAGPEGAVGGALGLVLGLGGILGVWSLWLNYGISHRGRTPRRSPAGQTSR